MSDATGLLDPLLGAVRQETITLGMSGARVLRMLNAEGQAVAIVKMVEGAAESIAGEVARLTWLARIGVRVPEVLGAGETWFAMRVLPGRPASDPWSARERDDVIDLVAGALRELHARPVDDAPFARPVSAVVEEVRDRVSAGPVGISAHRSLAELEEAVAALGDGQATVSHGDFSLPNVLVLDSGGVGFVDVGGAGLADPHSDVADLVRSLRSDLNPQFGSADAERFLDAYGRDRIDPERLRLHDLLNSFF